MGSRRSNPDKNPQLPAALRWLRHEARMTQSEVAAAARAHGHSLSDVYYRQCESDSVPKYPSVETLDAILEAVGSNQAELEQVLAAPPWEETPFPIYDTNVRMRKESTPKPSSSYNLLRSHAPLDQSFDPFAGPLLGSMNAADSVTGHNASMSGTTSAPAPAQAMYAAFAGAPSPATAEASVDQSTIETEVAEVSARYRSAPRGTQLTVLGLLRQSGGHS